MASDQSLKLTIATEADTKGLDQAGAALDAVAVKSTAAEKAVGGAAEGMGKMDSAMGKAAGAVGTATDALKSMGDGVESTAQSLPGLVSALGGGGGLAAVVGLVATGLVALYKEMTKTQHATEDLTGATIEATIAAQESGLANAEKAQIDAEAAAAVEGLAEKMKLATEATAADLAAIKDSATATKELITQKQALLEAEKALALARVDADTTTTPAEKIRLRAGINAEADKATNAGRQGIYAAEQAAALAEADALDTAAGRERAAAQAAAAAAAGAKGSSAAAAEGAARIAQGRGAVGVLQEEIRGGDYLGRENGYVKGLAEGLTPEGQAASMLAKAREQQGEYATMKKDAGLGEDSAVAEAMRKNAFIIERLEKALDQIARGKSLADGAATDGPGLDAEAKALGDPDTHAAAAGKYEAQATAARRRAAQAGDAAANARKIDAIHQEAAGITSESTAKAAEEKAADAAEKKAAAAAKAAEAAAKRDAATAKAHNREDHQEEGKLDQAQTLARKVARELADKGTGRKLDAASRGGDTAALLAIVQDLAKALETTKADVDEGLRKEIQDLKTKVANLRRNDKT